MSISGMKDELYALERFYEHSSMDKPVDLVVALRKAIQDIEKYHEREARTKKPLVKSYAGGKPNYCTPQPEVCCGEYARCLKVCIPKERWFAQQKLNVDAVNMSQERVDETAKGEHEWVGLTSAEVIQCQEENLFHTYANIEAKLKEKNT